MILISGICFIAPIAREVKAEVKATNSYLGEVVSGETIQTEGISSAKVPEGYVFGGWCEDDKETLATSIEESKNYYPRYVDDGVLSAKMQVKTNDDETKSMRIVSSVDGCYYKWVGFDIYFDENAKNADESDTEITPVTFKTKKVSKRISAKNTGVTYNYSPKVIDTKSEFFVSGTIVNIAEEKLDKDFYIKPFWITMDGTKIYGENRYVTVNDGTNKTNVNIPVKMATKPESSLSVNIVTHTATETATVSATASLAAYKEGYAHLNVPVTDKTTLASSTLVTVGENSAVYRNLDTSYNGENADKSWYWVYKNAEGSVTETDFVIATNADLYGFASLVDDGVIFENKNVYLIADITVNEGTARDDRWESSSGTTYQWNAIGANADEQKFAGTFDGQGHTISGIVATNANRYNAMFALTSGATLKNFELTNSYFKSTHATGDCGSIVGAMYGGTLDTVYSNAIVIAYGSRIGGLIGQTYSTTTVIENCWFDGQVRTFGATKENIGGIVGTTNVATNITNCMNSGTVDTSAYKGAANGIASGGIVGRVANTTTINKCLNTGAVIAHKDDTNYGPIIGHVHTSTAAKASTIVDSYALECDSADTTVIGDGKTIATTYTVVTASEMKGSQATTNLSALDFSESQVWQTSTYGTPVLTAFADKSVDTDWYTGIAGATYYLYDRGDLYGFAELCNTYDFAGMTVKLANDIVVNAGEAEDWAKNAPLYDWTSIGNTTDKVYFSGTFDGQGNTIRGLYASNAKRYNALFAITSNATLKDFELTNSYFSSANATGDCGSIVGAMYGGMMDTVYSDATVIAFGSRIGGMIGQTNISVTTIRNCWYDGQVKILSASKENIGGIVGTTNIATTICDCLNSGTVDTSAYKGATNGIAAGGIVGRVAQTSTVENCLNIGVVKAHKDDKNYGPILGHVHTSSAAKASVITNSYAIKCDADDTTVIGDNKYLDTTYTVVNVSDIKGNSATNTLAGFDFSTDKVWSVFSYGAPMLTAFYEKTVDTGWYDGLATSTYNVADKADMYGLATLAATKNFSGMTVKLVDNIVLNNGDAKNWASEAPLYDWMQIGSYNASFGGVQFAGTFDGQGHTISGLYMIANNRHRGLFGSISSASTLKNFRLGNSYFSSTYADIGSIVGCMLGKAEAIYSNAIVDLGNQRSGGMFGQTNGATITNCWFAGAVTTKAVISDEVGGIIGQVTGATTINNCMNSGLIDASGYNSGAGGIIGRAGHTVTIENCLNIGAIKTYTGAANCGPIVGRVWNNANGIKSSITNTYALTCTSTDTTVKGDAALITSTYDFVEESAIIGTAAANALTGFDFATAKIWSTVYYGTPVLSSFYDKKVDTTWYDGVAGSTYYLYDMEDLYGFSELAVTHNFAGMTVKLANDITVNEGNAEDWASKAPKYPWMQIGTYNASFGGVQFAGIFDGQGHTLSGLYMIANNRHRGLFGSASNAATIKNFRLENSYFSSEYADIGSIVGCMLGKAEAIYSDAIVDVSKERSGGMFGQTNGSTITNCWYDGTLTTKAVINDEVGGIVGQITGATTISNCLNSGMIDASRYNSGAGGIVGRAGATVTIKACLNVGTISAYEGAANCGPIIGRVWNNTNGKKSTITNTYALTYASTDTTVKGDSALITSTYDFVEESAITGTAATTGAEGLFSGDNAAYWSTVSYSTPVLTTFYDKKVDTTWYNGIAGATYYLYDMQDLYGFTELADTNDFDGMTVKLANDITVNEAASKEEAASWATSAPKYKWNSIGAYAKPFKGTFDGEMHTINGIYVADTTEQVGGLFARTDLSATVKNLKLTNSYIYSSTRRAGSIAGIGDGTFSDIYSNAIVVCEQRHTGGLVGLVNAGITMSNCWFDGSVTCKGNGSTSNRITGGLIGYMYQGEMRMSNCLNSGVVDVSAYKYDQNADEEAIVIAPIVGGLVGNTGQNVTVAKIYDCVNVGEILFDETATNGYSPILGYEERKGVDGLETVVEIVSTYATTQCEDTSNVSGMVATREADAIKGENAATEMPLLDWETQWQTVEGKFPEIQFSQTGFVDKVDQEVDVNAIVNLQTLYANRNLYQGESHDHAANGGASDGTVPLANWLTQMPTLGLDFAASLDHNMVSHFNLSNWDKDKMLYGTEAGGTITGATAEGGSISYHYNMLFPSDTDLVNVLTSGGFKDKFAYTTEDTTGIEKYKKVYGDKVTYGQFVLPSLTKAELQNLIQVVKDNNGYFGLAHPVVTYEYSPETVDDYYFADETGFEVIFGNMSSSTTSTAYKAWKHLLTRGYRLWATAGKDGHADLTTDTLTSIYANKLPTENYLSEAYIRNLRTGNFTAGATGIQMCVGSTQMGGTGSFEGQKLEIGIGKIHKDHFDSSHEYRVDVWYEDSVVYTTRLQRENADEMTYISMDADSDCKYYRVVVYDATAKTRIAIGNPIWNSAFYSN